MKCEQCARAKSFPFFCVFGWNSTCETPFFLGVLDVKAKSCVIDATKCLQCLHELTWKSMEMSKKHENKKNDNVVEFDVALDEEKEKKGLTFMSHYAFQKIAKKALTFMSHYA